MNANRRRLAIALLAGLTACSSASVATERVPSTTSVGDPIAPTTPVPAGTDATTTSPITTSPVTTSPVTSPLPPSITPSTTGAPLVQDAQPLSTVPTVGAAPVRSGADVNVPLAPVGDPVAIAIPSIGVDSTIVPTGLLDDGTVEVPDDPTIAGWFSPGPRPGERGPAVVMGHVDSREVGPGVFYRLRDLQVGATVTVTTTTGPVDFTVTSVEQYAKDAFPTERVYGSVPGRALRLITCGGSFDRSIRHYRDNIIAFLVPSDGG